VSPADFRERTGEIPSAEMTEERVVELVRAAFAQRREEGRPAPPDLVLVSLEAPTFFGKRSIESLDVMTLAIGGTTAAATSACTVLYAAEVLAGGKLPRKAREAFVSLADFVDDEKKNGR
jgi:hypothetical protein